MKFKFHSKVSYCEIFVAVHYVGELKVKLEDRSQKKKIMFLHSKNKASRKGYKGEC